MTTESEAHSKLSRDEIRPSQAQKAGGVAETPIIGTEKGGPAPEKALSTHNNVPKGILGTAASKAAPDATQIAADPASQNQFGEEDNEYISGYKLYAALFSIICVFFLVLLDFSITATVSTSSPYDYRLHMHRYFRRRIS